MCLGVVGAMAVTVAVAVELPLITCELVSFVLSRRQAPRCAGWARPSALQLQYTTPTTLLTRKKMLPPNISQTPSRRSTKSCTSTTTARLSRSVAGPTPVRLIPNTFISLECPPPRARALVGAVLLVIYFIVYCHHRQCGFVRVAFSSPRQRTPPRLFLHRVLHVAALRAVAHARRHRPHLRHRRVSVGQLVRRFARSLPPGPQRRRLRHPLPRRYFVLGLDSDSFPRVSQRFTALHTLCVRVVHVLCVCVWGG